MKVIPKRDSDGHDAYDVLSDSGQTYHVRYCGSGDADPEYVSVWGCTCPAAKFRRGPTGLCKHVQAVISAVYDEWGDAIDLPVDGVEIV